MKKKHIFCESSRHGAFVFIYVHLVRKLLLYRLPVLCFAMMHWLSLLGRCGDTIACALKDLERRISLLVGMHRRFIDAQTLRQMVKTCENHSIFPLELQTYPLVMTNGVANLIMAIEIVDFPKKNGDFP